MKYKIKIQPVVIERQDGLNGVNLAEDLQSPSGVNDALRKEAAAVARKADLIAANTRELRKQLEQRRLAHLEHSKGTEDNADLLKSLAENRYFN